jgi:type IV pilus assembly protein PilC
VPEFVYVAADKAGKKVEGKMTANNEGELRMSLRGQGLRPIKISKATLTQMNVGSAIKGLAGGNDTVAVERLMNFIRQLQTMITSGVPLIQAIELFHEQETDATLKRILGACKDKINGGSFLWECFAMYPNTFERVFVALVRAGESSGTLDVMLKRVGKYLENSYRVKKLIKSSMTYPISVSVIAVGVITLMLTVVIPKFEAMIMSSGGEMPAPTKLVLWLSHSLVDNIIPITGMIGLMFFMSRSYLKTNEGRIFIQNIAFKMPLTGPLIIKSGVARFTRTLSTLLASGVPIVDSLEICKAAASHIAFEDAITEMKKEVELGSSFTNAMARQAHCFPRMALQMTSVGENTGNLDKMLEKVAEFYEEEVEAAIQGMLKLIEPAMLVIMGGIVGGLMISMYLPIFQMAGSAGGGE